MSDLLELSNKLNYHFCDKVLLERALCHRSLGKNNNERLEFLGDAAVNFIVGEMLFEHFPKAKEGELSRLRASLVKGETLAELARDFQLNEFLKLGHGEQRSGGSKRESILADAMEAIIGAIYLDSDFQTCQKVVLDWYSSRLAAMKVPNGLSNELKDPKTLLQEYLQARKFPLPDYDILETKGAAHNQVFRIRCKVNGLALTAEGKGTTRRKAEQAAAQHYMELLTHE